MITIEHAGTRVNVVVLGEFTLTDFKELEEMVTYKARFEGPVNLLFDLREMLSFTVDMAWEEIKFSRDHGEDFSRIAVLTQSQWVAWSAWLNQAFVAADVRVFEEETDARAWLDEAVAP